MSRPNETEPDAAPHGRDRATLIALVALVLGVGLMIPFEWWFTRLLGVLALFVFIAAGVFAIATPALLERQDDE